MSQGCCIPVGGTGFVAWLQTALVSAGTHSQYHTPPPVPDSRYIRGSLYSVTDSNPFPEPLVIFEAVGLKSIGHVQGPQALIPQVSAAITSLKHILPSCSPQAVFLSLRVPPQAGLLSAWLGLQHKRTGSLSPSPRVTFAARILLSLSLCLSLSLSLSLLLSVSGVGCV